MTNNKFAAAAQEYLARRKPGTQAQGVADEIKPLSIDEALAVQQEMIKIRTDGVGGWKCLEPLREGAIIVAPIFANDVQSGDVCKLMMDKGKARIEPEIVFVLNKDLPARDEDYTRAEIDEAIGGTFMALELMQGRFAPDADAEYPERLADCMMNQGLYIGPEIDKATAYAASTIDLVISQGDDVKELAGKHPNATPELAVYWMVNFMSKRGTTFKKGEAITTGSYKGIVEVDFDQATEIEYKGLGKYSVTFAKAD